MNRRFFRFSPEPDGHAGNVLGDLWSRQVYHLGRQTQSSKACHVIYHVLKNCWGIDESKGHDQIFEMPHQHVECRLPFVPLPDSDQMIGVPQIQFGEDGRLREGVEGGV